jgi:hypothetical protein
MGFLTFRIKFIRDIVIFTLNMGNPLQYGTPGNPTEIVTRFTTCRFMNHSETYGAAGNDCSLVTVQNQNITHEHLHRLENISKPVLKASEYISKF